MDSLASHQFDEVAALTQQYATAAAGAFPEEPLHRAVRLAAAACNADLAYIAFGDETHQWIAAVLGDRAPALLTRKWVVSEELASTAQPLIIADLQSDVRFASHPILGQFDYRFYAGVPLRTNDAGVTGTLCILRREPTHLADFQLRPLIDIASFVVEELNLRRRLATLANMCGLDSLTGLSNRRAFDNALGRAWRRAERRESPLSLLLIDLDWFKLLNDTMGHPAGDDALRAVAAILSGVVGRPYDIVARYGGEEFAILLPDTGLVGARQVADAIQAVLRLAAWPHPASPLGRLSASIGGTTLVGGASHPDALIAEADAALYAAKQCGRNRIVIARSMTAS